MSSEIRLIQTHDEYHRVEELQRQVWGPDELMVCPIHVLLTAQKNGGLVLGYFHQGPDGSETMAGFAFGFLGTTSDGQIKHCSHMLGVAPRWRSQNIGYQLKIAQRRHVLDQGIDLMTWTVDPLESRNNYLNLHKLRAVSATYIRDHYGPMQDELNAGMPSDRLQIDWYLRPPGVPDRESSASGQGQDDASQTGLNREIPVINSATGTEFPQPASSLSHLNDPEILIEQPVDMQAIKVADMDLARAWRWHIREVLETAFEAGYVACDFLRQDQRCYYLLKRDRSPKHGSVDD